MLQRWNDWADGKGKGSVEANLQLPLPYAQQPPSSFQAPAVAKLRQLSDWQSCLVFHGDLEKLQLGREP